MSIPPAKPYFPEEDLKKITEDIKNVLKDGMLTIWRKTEEFENRWKEYTKSKYAVALNSGTAAIYISLRVLGIGPSDEVAVPTNTFAATATTPLMVGAKIIFVDMDPKTYCMNIDDLNEKITPRTKAVIPVHHSGNMCDMKRITEIAEDNKLFVIEDAAHAHGSLLEGIHAGNFGNTGCFSFYPTKNMTTAEGGMVVTNDDKIADLAKIIRDQGKPDFFSTDVVKLGFNFRISELHSILGIYQLARLEEWVRRRNEIAKRYTRRIKKLSGLYPPFVSSNVRHSFYKYMVLCAEDVNRDELRAGLRNRGVSTSLQYDPLVHQLTYFKGLGFKNGTCPIAESMSKRIFSLPMYNQMTDEEVEYVCEALEEAVGKR